METLAGNKNKNPEVNVAVSHLQMVLSDDILLKKLLDGIQTIKKEKEQFVYISALLLQPLSGTCSLNSKEYNANLFTQLNMKPLSLVPMGIGQVTTWHGAPDGYCDLLPVFKNTTSTVHEDVENEDDSQSSQISEVFSGGKTTLEA